MSLPYAYLVTLTTKKNNLDKNIPLAKLWMMDVERKDMSSSFDLICEVT